MPDTAPDLLRGASADFLRRFSPFNRMEPEALAFLTERLTLSFHAAGEPLLTPDMGPPEALFIVQRGKVLARQSGTTAVTEYTTLPIGPGECFPIGALSANRPSTNSYEAVEDSFIFSLPGEDFRTLMQMSPVFHLFCTQYIASLLSQSRQQLQNAFAQRASEQQGMATLLGQLIKKPPVTAPPTCSIRDALQTMVEQRIGGIVVANEQGQPLGILTQSDVIGRVVLPGVPLEQAVVEVMTAAPHTLTVNATAYDAALEMATHGIRHLMVVEADGRLRGILSERDLFSLQRISLGQIRASMDGATHTEALRRVSEDIRQLALNLIAQGVGAEPLTRFISALNDALTQRIIDIELDRHGLHDLEYAWLAFGSEGRHEQTLSTDQDNGLIFVPGPDDTSDSLKPRLLDFARAVNQCLADCGFALCKGNIMASNPALCLTPEGWQQRFEDWMDEPDPQALLNASIFFDFRVISGNRALGDRLREWLNRKAGKNLAFLRLMAANALQVAPPIGRIRDFVLDEDGTLDLKTGGARLFVDVARIYALRTGVRSSATVQRLRQAASRLGGLPAEELEAIIDGFHFIQLLRLRAQHLEADAGRNADNRIRPDTLNELDRRILKEAFRQARKLQLRLKLDYQL
ncbi:MAG: DUF294 nucleotidyltransferase-like domain-containing protein [Rhodocyclaceae bacterium]